MTRIRILLVAAALLCATTALAQVANPVWPYTGQSAGPVAPLDTPLVSTTQPKFVNPLPIPVDLTPDKTTYPGWDYYEIAMAPVTGTAPFLSTGAPAGTQWLGLVDPTAGFCGATTTPCSLAAPCAGVGVVCTPNVTSPYYKQYTPVWGYGQVNMGGGPLAGAATYPSMNIRGTRNTPVKVKWINNAPNQHLFCEQPLNQNWPCGIDRTLMGMMAGNPKNTAYGPVNQYGSPQQPDNAMVVHFHGGEIPPNSDGFAELWFGNTTTASFYSGGLAKPIDPSLSIAATGAPLNLVRPIGNAMLYNYPTVNEAATLWYHDHTLGKTRVNVAAGPAGFFPINDPAVERALWGALPTELGYPFAKDAVINGVLTPGCSTAGILAGNCYDLNVAFQDRDFNSPTAAQPNLAKINFPNGMNWAVAAPLVPQQGPLTPGGNANVHPQWVPEYFGTFPIVNGMAWPFLNVEPRKYRFHFLDGSNARCWSLKRSDGLLMNVIGDDQGYLAAAAPTLKLLMCPGERYDVVIDFTGLLPGTLVTLVNDAPAPFPKGISPGPGDVKNPLQFKVVATTAPDKSVIPAALNTITPLTATAPPRQLVLNEVLDAITLYPLRVQIDGTSFEGAITETPTKGAVEQWQIINTTGDVHPIHLHLVKYQIVSRQTFDLNGFSALTGFAVPGNTVFKKTDVTPFLKGKPRLPAAYEAGWKDTALSYPGEVLTIIAKWDASWNTALPANLQTEACTTKAVLDPVTGLPVIDPITGLPVTTTTCGYQGDVLQTPPSITSPAFMDVRSGPYVWHCHIVDHEDNEMMRPVLVL